jgi:hypothetical protein
MSWSVKGIDYVRAILYIKKLKNPHKRNRFEEICHRDRRSGGIGQKYDRPAGSGTVGLPLYRHRVDVQGDDA